MRDVGNTLSNADVLEYLRTGLIDISRFERGNLKLAHYRLRPGNAFATGALGPDGRRTRQFVHDFADGPLTLRPRELLLVTPLERVFLADGIVADFRPASTLIEQGFGLTAGKLDPGYGKLGGQNQEFIMGLYNQLDDDNTFVPDFGLANISFVSFRALSTFRTRWSDDEIRRYSERDLQRFSRANDDGVFYHEDEDEDEDD